MSVLRLVVAWLIVAALPLQGLAAGSMLFCDQAAHATVTQQGGHDHATHGHDGDHKHHAATGDAPLIQQQDGGPEAGVADVDDGHACPICASCCNLVVLSGTPSVSLPVNAPPAPPLAGPSRVLTRDAHTPDKPPRA